MAKVLTEFKEFLLKGNLILLAIAFVMGTAFAAVVKALVTDIVTPIISAIVGKPSFDGLSFSINHSQFLYGDFLTAIVTFVSIGFAVFFFIAKPYEYFQKEDTSVKDCPECTSSIPAAAIRCPLCTAQIGTATA